MNLKTLFSKVFVWMTNAGRTCGNALKLSMKHRAFEESASIAFFTLFSFFPLIVLVVAGTGFFIRETEAQQKVIELTLRIIPAASHELISRNLKQVLAARTSMSIAGFFGLLWAATGMFATLSRNISRAWPATRPRNLLRARFVAIAIVMGLFILLIVFLLAQTALNVIAKPREIAGINVALPAVFHYASRIISYAFAYCALFLLYLLVPNTQVQRREAAAGALGALIMIELISRAIGFYLSTGLVRYNIIYGSLGTLVLFMFWTYAVIFIILWGAHISALLSKTRENGSAL